MPPFPPPVLETRRLRLRPGRRSDAPAVFEYASDPAVTRYLSWRTHSDVSETEGFLAAVERSWRSGEGHRGWVIERAEDGCLLGMIGADPAGHAVVLGYVLAREAWGRGYATEAVRAVSDAALEAPSLFRVAAWCDAENRASARVLEKAGLEREGLLRRFAVFPNLSEAPRDCLGYARVRP